MYQAIGIKRVVSTILVLGALTLAIVYWFSRPVTLTDWMQAISSSLTLSTLILFLLGQTRLFHLLWLIPLLKNLLPPKIDGNWTATLSSNWPVVSQRVQSASDHQVTDATPSRKSIKARVKFKATLAYVTMLLESETGYSTSNTKVVKLIPSHEGRRARIYYIYQNATNTPENTDEQFHHGAGYLDIVDDNDGLSLSGVYWTNRKWAQGLNTAGTITMTRAPT